MPIGVQSGFQKSLPNYYVYHSALRTLSYYYIIILCIFQQLWWWWWAVSLRVSTHTQHLICLFTSFIEILISLSLSMWFYYDVWWKMVCEEVFHLWFFSYFFFVVVVYLFQISHGFMCSVPHHICRYWCRVDSYRFMWWMCGVGGGRLGIKVSPEIRLCFIVTLWNYTNMRRNFIWDFSLV